MYNLLRLEEVKNIVSMMFLLTSSLDICVSNQSPYNEKTYVTSMHKDLINALFLHNDKCWNREGSDK